jgi:hypothetical protein
VSNKVSSISVADVLFISLKSRPDGCPSGLLRVLEKEEAYLQT